MQCLQLLAGSVEAFGGSMSAICWFEEGGIVLRLIVGTKVFVAKQC